MMGVEIAGVLHQTWDSLVCKDKVTEDIAVYRGGEYLSRA